jgi:hypothetical protein
MNECENLNEEWTIAKYMQRLILGLMQFGADAKFHERTPGVLAVKQRKNQEQVHFYRVEDCVDGSMVRAFDWRDTAVMQTVPGQI